MPFFDSKEEVLDIQLTDYGKQLLYQGKFKPAFYSFEDTDVIYNRERASNIAETQNSVDSRIKEETIYNKIISKISPINYLNESPVEPNLDTQNSYQTIRSKINSLGNIKTRFLDGQQSQTPNIKITFLSADGISGYSNTYNPTASGSSGFQPLQIPQFSIDSILRSTVVSSDYIGVPAKDPGQEIDTNIDPALRTFKNVIVSYDQELILPDSSLIYMALNPVYVLVEEENGENTYDNYEIEVYEVTDEVDDITGFEKLKKLDFVKHFLDLQIEDNKLKSTTEQLQNEFRLSIESGEAVADTTKVESYFDLYTDYYGEVIDSEICRLVSSLKSQGFVVDTGIQCPENSFDNVIKSDIYKADQEIIDKC